VFWVKHRFKGFLMIAILSVLSALAGAAWAGTAFDKPLVVLVYDQTCHAWCDKVRPVVGELKVQYGVRVDFAELDATQSVLSEAKKAAKQMGIEGYLGDFRDSIPLVAVFNARRSLIQELPGPKKISDYKKHIEAALESK
jgi:hypothetical protein